MRTLPPSGIWTCEEIKITIDFDAYRYTILTEEGEKTYRLCITWPRVEFGEYDLNVKTKLWDPDKTIFPDLVMRYYSDTQIIAKYYQPSTYEERKAQFMFIKQEK